MIFLSTVLHPYGTVIRGSELRHSTTTPTRPCPHKGCMNKVVRPFAEYCDSHSRALVPA